MNEETILQGQTMVNGNENPNNEQSKSSAWKQVSIGGVAGILMGAGAMYAADVYAAGKEEVPADDPAAAQPETVKVAEVSDDMSFKEAFDAAREQVGAGGVFRWHGGIYNTYTADEWNAMSDTERADFAAQVKPEVSAANIDANQITEATPDVNVHVHVHEAAQVAQEAPAATATDDVRVEDTHAAAQSQGDDDVRIVAYGSVQGHDAVALDLDNDGQADVAVIDVDDSHDLSAADVVVDGGGNMATLGDLAEMAQDPAMDPNLQSASYDNPEVAPDMPDYMPDANLDVIA